MNKLILLVFSIVLALSSCQRVDDNLYNLSKLDQYNLDDYIGHVDFQLDNSYTISPSQISIFTLTSGGNSIYAFYIGDIGRIATDTVIMYCHGNRDHNDFYWQRAKLLANVGGKNRFGVMMIDYRGYGMSQGKPTEEGLYEDVDEGLKWLKEKGLRDNRLIMYGFSVGTAPATKLAANRRSMTPTKLILEAPFASSAVMVQDVAVLDMPSSYITNLKINNADEIKKVNQPLLWLHGVNDDFLSIKTHGEVVFKNYHGLRGEAHRVDGAGHSTIPQTLGFVEYCKIIEDFITH